MKVILDVEYSSPEEDQRYVELSLEMPDEHGRLHLCVSADNRYKATIFLDAETLIHAVRSILDSPEFGGDS